MKAHPQRTINSVVPIVFSEPLMFNKSNPLTGPVVACHEPLPRRWSFKAKDIFTPRHLITSYYSELPDTKISTQNLNLLQDNGHPVQTLTETLV